MDTVEDNYHVERTIVNKTKGQYIQLCISYENEEKYIYR